MSRRRHAPYAFVVVAGAATLLLLAGSLPAATSPTRTGTPGPDLLRDQAAGGRAHLTVHVSGRGDVFSRPDGIRCTGHGGSICRADLPIRTHVTLRARPASGSTLSSWSGHCAGNATSCLVVLNASKSVSAHFVRRQAHEAPPLANTFPLRVSVSGAGWVRSVPYGIVCPSLCEARFQDGSSVTLTAEPSRGADFSGWGGACTGTSPTRPCTVTLFRGARDVSAAFLTRVSPVYYRLSVTVTQTGAAVSGDFAIRSSPGGINATFSNGRCGPCFLGGSFMAGTLVTLTAQVTPPVEFLGWGVRSPSACSGGTSTCRVTMTGDRIPVSAGFG